MALRTSATEQFSDARTGVPNPSVQVSAKQAGPNQTTAAAISGFGQLGGDIRRGQVEGELEKELASTANIIATLNDPNTTVTENADGTRTVDLTTSDPTGSIDQFSKRFQNLAASVDQGQISQERAAIEAEVVLRQSIARAPGFAAQLREVARETLGFNASGAAIGALFLSGPSSSDAITQDDRDNAEAQSRFDQGFYASFAAAKKAIVGERDIETTQAANGLAITNGEIDGPKLAIIGGNLAQEIINPIMLRGFKQIRNSEGVLDIESMRSGILTAAQVATDTIVDRMASNTDNIYKESQYQAARDEIARVRDANIQILDNQDLMEVLTRRQDLLQKVMGIKAFNVAPELMLMSQFGPKAVEEYLELVTAAKGDLTAMQELMLINPAYDYLGNVVLKSKDIGPAIRAISDGTLSQAVDNGEIDTETAFGAIKYKALGQLEGTGDPQEFDSVINTLADLDLPNMVLSTAAQTKNSFNLADPETRVRLAGSFKTTEEIIKTQLGGILTNTEFALAWDQDKGRLQVERRDQRAGLTDTQQAERGVFNPSTPRGPGGLGQAQLDVLNSTLLPLMRDPRWRNQFGQVDPQVWINNLISDTNVFAVQNELADPGSKGNIGQATVNQQVRIRNAMETGNQDEVFSVLNELGLGLFNEQAQGVGQPLERVGEDDIFVDLQNGNIIALDESGEAVSNLVGSGVIDRSARDAKRADEEAKLAAQAEELVRSGVLFQGKDLAIPEVPRFLDKRALTPLVEGRDETVQEAVVRAAIQAGIPPALYLALVQQESEFDINALSDDGAIGLAQLMPGTASDLGVDPNDPEQNLLGGAKYLAQQLEAFEEDVELALAAYNAGPTRVRKLGRVPEFAETETYIRKILGNLAAEEEAAEK